MINKLGRLPRLFDPAVPHLSSVRLMESVQIPSLPSEVHNAVSLPPDLGVMLNATLGDCTAAALYHAIQVWTNDAQGLMLTEPDAMVLQAYEESCGYQPGNPATDAGGAEQTVLSWALNTGMPMSDGTRNKLSAFVEIDPRNMSDVCQGIYECGLVYIGFSVPSDIDENPGSVWSGNEVGPIEGGHCVILPGYLWERVGGVSSAVAPAFDVISWGSRYTMTREFFGKYVDECYGLISPLWFNTTGRTPWGLDEATLAAIMRAVSEQG